MALFARLDGKVLKPIVSGNETLSEFFSVSAMMELPVAVRTAPHCVLYDVRSSLGERPYMMHFQEWLAIVASSEGS